MLHELKNIVRFAKMAKDRGIKTALVSVVALEGSSYRKPGVRMAVQENGNTVGAVSGGCVEKEICSQSTRVFQTNTPLVMEYDGRYRLGCEGKLWILIEPFNPSEEFVAVFNQQCVSRQEFTIVSYFSKHRSERLDGGSYFHFSAGKFSASEVQPRKKQSSFAQIIPPAFKLIIMGCEHDAVQLCHYAAATGWEVQIVAPIDALKSINDFPGATSYLAVHEKELDAIRFDAQTAVVIMSHSYAKDLRYLSRLVNKELIYIGLLGPRRRREQLFNELLEKNEWLSEQFFDKIYGPAGINIGAETPQEIAISILAEILSVIRNQKPISLKDKPVAIHR